MRNPIRRIRSDGRQGASDCKQTRAPHGRANVPENVVSDSRARAVARKPRAWFPRLARACPTGPCVRRARRGSGGLSRGRRASSAPPRTTECRPEEAVSLAWTQMPACPTERKRRSRPGIVLLGYVPPGDPLLERDLHPARPRCTPRSVRRRRARGPDAHHLRERVDALGICTFDPDRRAGQLRAA